MDRSRIGIVIPALNEAATIQDVVGAVKKYGVPIVIDDGSSDGTAELARQAGAFVVSHERNRGYDAALNSGFKEAARLGKDVIVTIDADGQHDPSILEKFIDRIEAGADMVVGVRNRRQRIAEHMFAWFMNMRFGIKDPLCGMKAYRTIVYEALGHFDSYGSIGTELTVFAAKREYRLDQVPFVVRQRKDQPRFGRAFMGNYKIFRAMVLAMWRGW